jgi:hypothetical protein
VEHNTQTDRSYLVLSRSSPHPGCSDISEVQDSGVQGKFPIIAHVNVRLASPWGAGLEGLGAHVEPGNRLRSQLRLMNVRMNVSIGLLVLDSDISQSRHDQ